MVQSMTLTTRIMNWLSSSSTLLLTTTTTTVRVQQQPNRYPQRRQQQQQMPVLIGVLLVLLLFVVNVDNIPTTDGFLISNGNSCVGTTSSSGWNGRSFSGGGSRLEQVIIPGGGKQLLPIPSLSSSLRLLLPTSVLTGSSECLLRRFRMPPIGCRDSIHVLRCRYNNYYNNRYTTTSTVATTVSKGYVSSSSQTQCHSTALPPLYSLASGSVPPGSLTWIQLAMNKFRDRPGTYLLIPVIAAFVGWFTNWLAVQMIFYPIQYRGIQLYRPNVENPLGLVGWQGIIPCKTRPMSNALVDMVTTQLLTVSEAFGRIDPKYIATALSPSLLPFSRDVVQKEVLHASSFTNWIFNGPSRFMNGVLLSINTSMLEQLTKQIQLNAEQVFQLRSCVVNQMMDRRSKLGELFQQCGKAELNFLTNSGLWFGFLLGIIQMLVALVWDNPWSLSIGGGIVGLATNWLALKWIFEPVDPIKLGPFILQGKFLRRQTEVAATFAQYFANHVLSSRQIWNSMLTDPKSTKVISSLLGEQIQSILRKCTFGLWRNPLSSEALQRITDRAIQIDLPKSVPIIFPYMDKVLGLEHTLRVRMERMTSRQFERVLHPIFEEDEMTLIIAGAVLGFGAGLIQQGLEMNIIQLPKIHRVGTIVTTTVAAIFTKCRRFWVRKQPSNNNNNNEEDDEEEDNSATDI